MFLRLTLFLFSLSVVLVSGYELNRRYQEQRFLVMQTEPLNQADTLLAQNRWREARMLAATVETRPALGDLQRARSIEIAADAALDSVPLQLKSFVAGALSGESSNGASLAGALTLDLFIIGDIRDLLVQGYREAIYEDGDQVVLALSAAGLGLALLPEVHWAPAILKGLKRTGALSERFIRILRKHSRYALETGDFKPLAKIVDDFARATRELGPGPVSGAMKAVETETDLTRLAASAAINPKQSYAVATLGSTRGLRMLNKNGSNVSSVIRRLKLSSRLAKSARKSLGVLPDRLLLLIFLGALAGLLLSTRRK